MATWCMLFTTMQTLMAQHSDTKTHAECGVWLFVIFDCAAKTWRRMLVVDLDFSASIKPLYGVELFIQSYWLP